MKYLLNTLALLGGTALAAIVYVGAINFADADTKVAETSPAKEVAIDGYAGLDMVRDVLAATKGAVDLSIKIAAPDDTKGGVPFVGKLAVHHIGPIVDRVLKAQGDLAKDECTKLKWAGPTKITKVGHNYIDVRSVVQASLYKDFFKSCNVKVWGPDHKTVTARITLGYAGDTLSALVHRIDVKKLGDWIEDKADISKPIRHDLLKMLGIDNVVAGSTMSVGFEGDGDKLELVVKGELLTRKPVVTAVVTPKSRRFAWDVDTHGGYVKGRGWVQPK